MVRVHDLEPAGPGGAVRFGGVSSVCSLSASTGSSSRRTPWDESDEIDSGQEEVVVVISGSGLYRIDGEEVPVDVGTFLRFDPETTRVPVAGPAGMALIAVGAKPGSYEPRGPF